MTTSRPVQTISLDEFLRRPRTGALSSEGTSTFAELHAAIMILTSSKNIKDSGSSEFSIFMRKPFQSAYTVSADCLLFILHGFISKLESSSYSEANVLNFGS